MKKMLFHTHQELERLKRFRLSHLICYKSLPVVTLWTGDSILLVLFQVYSSVLHFNSSAKPGLVKFLFILKP